MLFTKRTPEDHLQAIKEVIKKGGNVYGVPKKQLNAVVILLVAEGIVPRYNSESNLQTIKLTF